MNRSHRILRAVHRMRRERAPVAENRAVYDPFAELKPFERLIRDLHGDGILDRTETEQPTFEVIDILMAQIAADHGRDGPLRRLEDLIATEAFSRRRREDGSYSVGGGRSLRRGGLRGAGARGAARTSDSVRGRGDAAPGVGGPSGRPLLAGSVPQALRGGRGRPVSDFSKGCASGGQDRACRVSQRLGPFGGEGQHPDRVGGGRGGRRVAPWTLYSRRSCSSLRSSGGVARAIDGVVPRASSWSVLRRALRSPPRRAPRAPQGGRSARRPFGLRLSSAVRRRCASGPVVDADLAGSLRYASRRMPAARHA